MRIIAIEEHFNVPELLQSIPASTIASCGWTSLPDYVRQHDKQLADLGEERIAAMNTAGITMQIIAIGGPGANLLDGAEAVHFASTSNDLLAAAVRKYPDRFDGFAHLPITEPEAAAEELGRCVAAHGFKGAMISGLARGKFLDDPVFEPVLARAEKLNVPLYLHPDLPPRAVQDAYYSDLPDEAGILMASAGWGWHYETSVHVLRLAVSGALERHPKLKLIIGHMGEGLPAMLGRCDQIFAQLNKRRGQRGVSETLGKQLWITTSGFHDRPSFEAAREAFGIDRILFSTDYPYNSSSPSSFFSVANLSAEDESKIAAENVMKLLRIDQQNIAS